MIMINNFVATPKNNRQQCNIILLIAQWKWNSMVGLWLCHEVLRDKSHAIYSNNNVVTHNVSFAIIRTRTSKSKIQVRCYYNRGWSCFLRAKLIRKDTFVYYTWFYIFEQHQMFFFHYNEFASSLTTVIWHILRIPFQKGAIQFSQQLTPNRSTNHKGEKWKLVIPFL